MFGIAPHSFSQGAGEGFEEAFGLVVLVGARGVQMEVHLGSDGEGVEEMVEHFGGHVAYAFALERGVPNEPGAPAQVEGALAEAVVHREHVAVALHAEFVAYGATQTFAQGEGGVFNGVVLVNVEVAVRRYL